MPQALPSRQEYRDARNARPKKSGLGALLAVFSSLLLIAGGGYFLVQKFTGGGGKGHAGPAGGFSSGAPNETGNPSGSVPGQNLDTIDEDDFQWRQEVDYYRIPEGAVALSYMEILGEWKLLAVNYLPDLEEQHYSFATISEYLPDEAHLGANTSVQFKHQYTQFDGEKYYFDNEEDATDMVLASFGEGILQIALSDDKVMDVLFWEKDGKQYGHSYLFRDDDQDGFADLVFAMSFVR